MMTETRIQVVAANGFTLFCGLDGSVWSCGRNISGQLGHGDNLDRSQFEQVAELPNILQISCLWCHVLCLDENGDVWSWGKNDCGQLGLGDKKNRLSPCKVPGLPKINQISAGGTHSLCLDETGQIWACGSNEQAQLGIPNGKRNHALFFVSLGNPGGVTAVETGFNSSYFISDNEACFGVGYNAHGQLGLGHSCTRPTPTKIPISDVKRIFAGPYRGMIYNNKQEVYVMGKNESGQLGIGECGANCLHPTLLSGACMNNDLIDIACGTSHTLLLDSEGKCWASGNNYEGQLGTGQACKSSNINVPVCLHIDSKIVSISCGLYHSAVVDENETLWMFGSNSYGQLGTNSQTPFYREPVRVIGRCRSKSANSAR